MTLKQQVFSGFKWSAASQFGRQAMQLATTAILARLLSPADFGLMGMATVAVGFAGLFRDLGTGSALIQRAEVDEGLLRGLFWVNAGFGLFAAGGLLLLAPLIALFYHEPRVTPLLQMLSLAFLCSGLAVVHQALLERRLGFRPLARVELASVLFGAAVGIGTALAGHGVWSLVWQALASAVLSTLLLWGASGWRPGFCCRWHEMRQVREVAGYSLNLTGYNVFNYFARNADYLLVGRYLGAVELGYYTLAYRLMLYPLQNVSAVVGRVLFPLFARLRDDDVRFRAAFRKAAAGVALLTFPLMLGLLALAEPFVFVVFGPAWQPVVLLLQILAPVGMAQSVVALVGPVYQAKGRTDWMFRWGFVAGTLFILSFVAGLRWGVVGVATAYAAVFWVLAYPALAIPLRLIDLHVQEVAAELCRPLLCGMLMLLVLLAAKLTIPTGWQHWLVLAVLVPVGASAYFLGVFFLSRKTVEDCLEVLKGGS
jgi:PST family polysaccharide transporter